MSLQEDWAFGISGPKTAGKSFANEVSGRIKKSFSGPNEKFLDKTCLQHVLQEIFSPSHRQIFRQTTKRKTNALKKFPTEEQSHRTHSTESSNAAEISPKARDPDQCMYRKPC